MLIYICDDSVMDLHMTRHSLERYATERNLTFTIHTFASGSSLLEEYKNTKLQPALLFLDIYMVDLSGIETAKELRASGFTETLSLQLLPRNMLWKAMMSMPFIT